MNYPRTFDLAYWINEREAMRLRREAGIKPPWSPDPIMATVRYCNVHREDDKVTKWIRTSGVYSGVSVPVWVVVLARMVNRIETLSLIRPYVEEGSLEKIKSALKHARGHGPIWGSAYTISTCGKSMDKVEYVIDHVVQAVMQVGDSDFDSLESCFDDLTCVDGLGSFLAAQVVADLKNTPGHTLTGAVDWFTWCAPGPGSLRGLTAYYGRTITPGAFRAAIDECYAQTMPYVNGNEHPGGIHMQDFQNCLCEFSKYIRVQEGGHARNRYTAG